MKTFCKHSKRAVTPAIATMVMISVTLVLALVVGAYTYGIFGSNYAAITFTLTSASLFGGLTTDNVSGFATSYFQMFLRNPGPTSSVNSIVLTGAALGGQISSWSIAPDPQPDNSLLVAEHNVLAGGSVAELTLYPVHNPMVVIRTGQIYEYIILFSTGQTISGSIVAQ
jgi:hypothetical protein